MRSRGAVIWLVLLLLTVTAAAMAATQLAHVAAGARREATTERALARAREALLAHATDRAIGAVVGPGYLPCPDIDGDGWAEPICGSLEGDRGNAERLGLLPWKTLGLDDLRDGHGARLWYAVATKYKGLLNCAASAACVDMSPASLRGTISVRDAGGAVTHDGTLADSRRPGAAAVVIAPGPPIARQHPEPRAQQRAACAGRCDARDYLDAAPAERGGEDNADFIDRLDAGRAANANGFIRGPVHDARGVVRVNDRVLAIGEGELQQRLMRRVALEVAHCLRFYASRPENAGRYPAPSPACGPGGSNAGRVPDTPFTSAGTLPRWWRAHARTPERLEELPTAPHACRIAVPPGDEGPARTHAPGTPDDEGASVASPAWWTAWRPHVSYARCDVPACMRIENASGDIVGRDKDLVVIVSRARDACTPPGLECNGARCTLARLGPTHELVALP